MRVLVELRQRHFQHFALAEFHFAPDGEKQAYDAAGPGAFFDAGRFASGIASACAARISATPAVSAAMISGRFDAVVSLREPKAPEIDGELFARETLMLSVPREHPCARRKSVLLAGEKSFRLAVLRGDGAYVRRLKPFLARIARERGVEIFDDGFVFLQQPDLEKIPALTTRLVRRYRSEGANRVFVPLEDEGVSAEYRISYLRGNRRAVAPFLAWARETRELLSGD